jgi:ATP-binding cassette subfamily F protein uup
MAPPLIQLTDIALTFGGRPLLDGVDLAVGAGERICLVGRNGSGKSTLLAIAAGTVEPDRGERFVQPGALLRTLPQEPDLSGFATTLAYVEAGLSASDDPHQARYLLEQLGLSGNEDPAQLSGGEARRAALARALAPDPDILLLDEPTNHLDIAAITWLEDRLANSRAALVIISHDRRFLERLSRTTVWLDRGRARRVELPFSGFEDWRDQQLADEEMQQHKIDRKIVAEEHWVHGGVTGRRKRNVRRMAELRKLRQERREYRGVQGKATLTVAEAETSSTLVAEAKGISKSYGDLKVVRNLSLRLMRGDRLGIVGPNGSGKTTLLSLVTGTLAPDAGEVRLGPTVSLATLEQSRDSLDPNWTLSEALTRGRGDVVTIGGEKKHVVAYMKDFLFQPEQRRTPINALSGGERGRLMLARALAQPSNLLVLDEPTNDLDLETLDVLEEALAGYQGTVILISHDRDFLDRVVTSVIVPEGDGRWTEYAGGYQDMLAQRGQDLRRREAASKPAPSSAPSEAAQKSAAPEAAAAPKKKLSFKDKHALETLPAEIAALEAKKKSFSRLLDDPDLYTRDRKRFADISEQLGEVENALAAAEERWLELELLRSEIEG